MKAKEREREAKGSKCTSWQFTHGIISYDTHAPICNVLLYSLHILSIIYLGDNAFMRVQTIHRKTQFSNDYYLKKIICFYYAHITILECAATHVQRTTLEWNSNKQYKNKNKQNEEPHEKETEIKCVIFVCGNGFINLNELMICVHIFVVVGLGVIIEIDGSEICSEIKYWLHSDCSHRKKLRPHYFGSKTGK